MTFDKLFFDSGEEVKNNQFVRIDWPNGSFVQGSLHLGENGYTALRFGPEDAPHWMKVAKYGKWLPFVQQAAVSLVAS